MLFCLCTQFSYSEEPECDAGKSGKKETLPLPLSESLVLYDISPLYCYFLFRCKGICFHAFVLYSHYRINWNEVSEKPEKC